MVRTATDSTPSPTPSAAPKPTTSGISPRRRYLRFLQVWMGSRAASRRRIRSTLRELDPASRRRMMQSAVFNIVRSLNEEAGATPSSSGATTNRMLRGESEPLRAARPLVNLYRRTTAIAG